MRGLPLSKSLACSLGLDSCFHRSGTHLGINKIIAFPGYLISVISLVFSRTLGFTFWSSSQKLSFSVIAQVPSRATGQEDKRGKNIFSLAVPMGRWQLQQRERKFPLSQSFGCRITWLWNTIKQRKKNNLKKIKRLLFSPNFRSFLFYSSTRTWGLLFDLSI